ncbi:MAG TPA: NAD-binding protein [Anaerolineales bacterium]
MKSPWRKWRAGWRDTLILMREFQMPLIVFIVVVVGGGYYYRWLSGQLGEPIQSTGEAIYIVLSATFLQVVGDFPQHVILQTFHFLMPIVGIIILAQGLADFGGLLFNRRARSKEWEMAVASTMKDHIVLVGLGHLGYRVVHRLHEMGREVVVIEQNPSIDSFKAVQAMSVPVIQEDGTRNIALEAANIKDAHTVILATQNDAMNLQIALKARGLNPNIEVVIRIFDEDFAHELHDQFGFNALSATEMAAPVFAAAAAGANVTNPISIEGQQLSLARIKINPTSKYANQNVGFVEDNYHLNIILLRRDGQSEMHPTDAHPLQPGDTLAVLGGPQQLAKLVQDNQ